MRLERKLGGFGAVMIIGACAAVMSFCAQADALEQGKAVYKDANCIGCHKWHGLGGGGYGGAALSLRETRLEREFLIEVIRCGRPATRMPYHDRRAWPAKECFGATLADMGDAAPPEAAKLLRMPEVEAVADYVLSEIKGRDAPTKDECMAFWGAGARECARF